MRCSHFIFCSCKAVSAVERVLHISVARVPEGVEASAPVPGERPVLPALPASAYSVWVYPNTLALSIVGPRGCVTFVSFSAVMNTLKRR